ncbi:arabinose efflux permease family protein [Acidovorax sp. CF316]|uniref:TCR/Tet family MFS transporter n=1 Tax=Acidovorax sp. CF316 TaxID=1144317 RepID=UPI00026BC7DD|nr:tetracycline resistance MFS efflux pump [Acidovorax sp. CF316]EJE50166.1 arabinose efflux permease family protein [Acidovorax sp. CF316]
MHHRTPSLFAIYLCVALDAMGIGLVFPILPALVQDVTQAAQVAPVIGVMAALYAAMQLVCAPVLGALSDRLGRRPVLLLSLAGACASYLLLACAGSLPLLLLGRAVAGLTGASMSVATAYLTDVTPEDQRARRFGLFNAMFGAGFIAGPVLGGLLGDHGVRLPFIAAAVLNGTNFVLAWVSLPESRQGRGGHIDLAALNPLRPLAWVLSQRQLVPLVFTFFMLAATGEAYAVCWALWGGDAFHWNGTWIGLSLGAFGLCQMLVQAFAPGPASRWLGERGAVLAGVACACLALVAMAFMRQGWMVFVAMPVFALGSIGTPALQALASRQVGADLQGQFQGVLASAISLASIIAPLGFSAFYHAVRSDWPGAIWLLVVAVYAVAVPLVVLGTRRPRIPGRV